MLRLIAQIPDPADVGGYDECLHVVWAFAPKGSTRSLTPSQLEITNTFEILIRSTLERDALAVLTAIVTFDGARQWVFYTSGGKASTARLERLLAGQDYPVEIGLFKDAGWGWLRDEVVGDKLERATTSSDID